MRAHDENGRAVAKFLSESSCVEEVIYPGLASHPQHELANRQMTGYGGMISFRLKDAGLEKSNAFMQALRVYALAESLGGVESLVELPAVMTHAALTPEARKELGVTDNLIRMSCGIEDKVDLVGDLKQALEAVYGKK
jgi:cystathionine gamma-lyase